MDSARSPAPIWFVAIPSCIRTGSPTTLIAPGSNATARSPPSPVTKNHVPGREIPRTGPGKTEPDDRARVQIERGELTRLR